MDGEQRWQNFKSTVNETARDLVGFKRKQHKPWITDRSRELSEKQRRLRVETEDETNGVRRMGLRAERRAALHELHNSLKNDENKFWE